MHMATASSLGDPAATALHTYQQNMYVGVSVFFSIFLLRLLLTTRSSAPAAQHEGAVRAVITAILQATLHL
jgi:hypothetical protein